MLRIKEAALMTHSDFTQLRVGTQSATEKTVILWPCSEHQCWKCSVQASRTAAVELRLWYGLDSLFIAFSGKDVGPTQIAHYSPLKAAGGSDLLSPQAASLEESPLFEQTRWVSYSQATGGSQPNTGNPWEARMPVGCEAAVCRSG